MEIQCLLQDKSKNILMIEDLSKQRLAQNLDNHRVLMTERELKSIKEKNKELTYINKNLKEDKENLGQELLNTQQNFREKLTNALDSLRNEQREKNMLGIESVSYTHLTLPTKA